MTDVPDEPYEDVEPDLQVVRVSVELEVAICDRGALHSAAVKAVSQRDYSDSESGLAERAADLEAAAADVGDALLDVIDTYSAVPESAGIELRGDSMQVALDSLASSDTRIDFGSLFGGHGIMTPWLAAVLHGSAHTVADDAYDDVLAFGDEPVTDDGEWSVFDEFPRITWRQDAVWRRRAARAADDLAADLERGDLPLPRCAAEEMALHLLIRRAAAHAEDVPEILQAWAGDAPEPVDWEVLVEDLTQDSDILNLFDADMDGIDDPDSDENQSIGMGDYRPAAWFEWFGGSEPRDGRRPFRR